MNEIDYKKLFNEARKFFALEWDYTKLTAVEKLAILLSASAFVIVVIIICTFALSYLFSALITVLAGALGCTWGAQLIAAVLLLLLLVNDNSGDWQGMTLEQLRRARAKALVRREVGRATMQYSIDNVKDNVSNNGVRALMFSPGTVSHLKTADYVLLGFRLTRWLMGLRSDNRRRRRRR